MAEVWVRKAGNRTTATKGPSHPSERRPLAGDPGRDQGSGVRGKRRGNRSRRAEDLSGKAEATTKAGAKPQKAPRGNGLERLRRAAGRRLAQSSEELADVLLDKALKGRLQGARMLVGLAEKIKPRKRREEEDKWDGPSAAELLAAEPEWVEPEVGDVWNGNGWVRVRTGERVSRSHHLEKEEEEAA
jgi:hypothetical protein